jgi:EF-hand domain
VRPFLEAILAQQQLQQQQLQLQQEGNNTLPAPPPWPQQQQQQQDQHQKVLQQLAAPALQQQHQQPQQRVEFSAFRDFVLAREEGLRQAFRQFDVDGDGCISADDLHLSLARVAICSPANR